MEVGMRSFLKWAGGKFDLFNKIEPSLRPHDMLIEPFVGAGSIFLRSNYKRYIINDINSDLIALYRNVQSDPSRIIADSKDLFSEANNQPAAYYSLRSQFNQSSDQYERALLFLYLNRHGYQGLSRYNNSGIFNVPFGNYKNPFLPVKELSHFSEKMNSCDVSIHNKSFEDLLTDVNPKNAQIYSDPPYIPISKSSNFTSYSGSAFGIDEHHKLHDISKELSVNNSVLLSNSNTKLTRELYKGAERIRRLTVRRRIAQTSRRKNITELLVEY